MALWSHKKEFIFKAVEEMYTDVASRPGAVFHFPTGRLACLFVGYPAEQLDCLPEEATESFAGVGYPFAEGIIRQGDAVLDVGSGSGTDTLIAAMLTGPSGVVYGLDMTRASERSCSVSWRRRRSDRCACSKGMPSRFRFPTRASMWSPATGC
jgi:hypothetical protein